MRHEHEGTFHHRSVKRHRGGTARLAVAQGWQVGLFARSEDKLDALVGELGDKAAALPGDVTNLHNLKTAMGIFVGKTGGLTAAFANAGMGRSAADKRRSPSRSPIGVPVAP
jgi:NADP-dependent 3-hydroxy acid dehydrogenase YdfG